MNVLYDAYTEATPIGHPIQTPPILSVDSRGQITIAFSTGDQENLTPDPTTFNYVASLTEAVVTSSPGVATFAGQLNWQEELTGGKLVLGPMTLFDKTLYFSTFMQAVTTSCNDIGVGSVWGLDYLLPKTNGSPSSGGQRNLATQDFPNAIISGVGLRQLPSCSSAASIGASSDAFLDYGTVSTTATTVPGQLELVIQLGGGGSKGSGSGGTVTPGTPNIKTIPISPPKTPVRIDSWAPIIE